MDNKGVLVSARQLPDALSQARSATVAVAGCKLIALLCCQAFSSSLSE